VSGISQAGNGRLRALLTSGATSAIEAAMRPGGQQMTGWLQALLQRKPHKVVAVAFVNKVPRVAWAPMKRGEAYRARPPPW
jgi:transposase